MSLDSRFSDRMVLPIIAAPMFTISGPDLVVACCEAGVVGAFPTAHTRSVEELEVWFEDIYCRLAIAGERDPGRIIAPPCANLIVNTAMNPHLAAHLEIIQRHQVEIIITSVGSPRDVIAPIHEYGGIVLADVASLRHAERAIEAGCDGLILLTAGAGEQTGWANPFAFVRQVRDIFDGIIVLAGGVTDAHGLRAAEVLGCDLAYMGTRFIATQESLASAEYIQMLLDATIDDIVLSRAFGLHLESNWLGPSLEKEGFDVEQMKDPSVRVSREVYAKHYANLWSAGHGVGNIRDVPPAGELIRRLATGYKRLLAAGSFR